MPSESCPSVVVNSCGPRGWPCCDTGLFMTYLGRVLFIRIDERLTPHAFERFLGELGRAIDLRMEGQLCGVIYDVPDAISMDAVRRRRLAEVLSERARRVSSTTVGLALASPSKITRGVLEAVFWMSPPSYAHTAVDTVFEALLFMRHFLPEVNPEEYAFEYRRLLARNGALSNNLRPPLSRSPLSRA
jgi:hypothetical protein